VNKKNFDNVNMHGVCVKIIEVRTISRGIVLTERKQAVFYSSVSQPS